LGFVILFAPLGGTARGWARADGRAAAPHNAGGTASADQAAEIARLQREKRTMRMERDIFKKVDRDLCWSSDMRFRFIEDRRADYPVTIMCGVLGVSPAGYYAWRSRPESQRSAANRGLLSDIVQVHRANRGCMAVRASMPSCGLRAAGRAADASSG